MEACKRKNAVGNAFAVPVIARLLTALVMTINFPKAGAFPAWSDPALLAPYKHDTLDDLLPEAALLAQEFQSIASRFDNFMAPNGNMTWWALTQGQSAERIDRNEQQAWVPNWEVTFPETDCRCLFRKTTTQWTNT